MDSMRLYQHSQQQLLNAVLQMPDQVQEEEKGEDIQNIMVHWQPEQNNVWNEMGEPESIPQLIQLNAHQNQAQIEDPNIAISSSDDDISSLQSIPDEHNSSFEEEDYINSYKILAKGVTWNRDSHGLFDYEQRHPNKKQMSTEEESKLVRVGCDLHFLPSNQDVKEVFGDQGQLLLTIKKEKNRYHLEAPKMAKNDDLLPQYHNDSDMADPQNIILPCDTVERMYIVVRSMKKHNQNSDYQLKKHDVIKLGRVKFKVKEINLKSVREQKEKERKRKVKKIKKEKGTDNGKNDYDEELIQQLQQQLFSIDEASKFDQFEGEQNFLEIQAILNNTPINQCEIKKVDQIQKTKNNEHNVIPNEVQVDGKKKEEEKIIEQIQPKSLIKRNDEQEVEFANQAILLQNNSNNLVNQEQQVNVQDLIGSNGQQVEKNLQDNEIQQVMGQIVNQIVEEQDQIQPLAANQQEQQQVEEEAKEQRNNSQEQQQLIEQQVNEQMNFLNNNLLVDQQQQDQSQDLSPSSPQKVQIVRHCKSNNQLRQDSEEEKQGNLIQPKKINSSEKLVFAASMNAILFSQQINKQLPQFEENEQQLKKSNSCHDKEEKKDSKLGEEKKEEEIAEQAITKMDINEQNEIESVNNNNRDIPQCRFCWDSETSVINPLLSGCKCKGGVQYVHYHCLKEWVQTKRQCKEGETINSYYWKNFECEICKTPYPYVFKAQGYKYNLIEIQKPQGDYLILESLSLEKNTSRMIHILTPARYIKSFKIGRGHDSDLRINDISVSRTHAMIKFSNNKFFLQDNMSKFGTLVLIRKKIPIQPKTIQAVQVGRSLINFCVQKCKQRVYKCGDFMKSKQQQQANSLQKQEVELKKLYLNMRNAAEYIQMQQAEHQRLKVTDNFHNRNNYQRRLQQNVLEDELKINMSQESSIEEEEEEKNEEQKLEDHASSDSSSQIDQIRLGFPQNQVGEGLFPQNQIMAAAIFQNRLRDLMRVQVQIDQLPLQNQNNNNNNNQVAGAGAAIANNDGVVDFNREDIWEIPEENNLN